MTKSYLQSEEKAEALMRAVVGAVAGKISGLVCAQVNPARAGDREGLCAMASRVHQWAPNIAIKLPATAAGLDVLEDCVAEGMTVTATVSFTVPQVLAQGKQGSGIRDREHRSWTPISARRALQSPSEPTRCIASAGMKRGSSWRRCGGAIT